MRFAVEGGLPVIEGTAEELVKLATAATGAVNHQEAVAFHAGKAVVGVRLRESELQVLPDWYTTWTEETGGSDG